MGKIYINEIGSLAETEAPIVSFFYLDDVQMKEARNGSHYLLLRLSDKTGSVSAYMWEDFSDVLAKLEPGIIVKVQAELRSYRGKLSLTLRKIRPATDADESSNSFEESDFYQEKIDIDQVADKIFALIDQVKNPFWSALLSAFFNDPLFREQFFRAPAAKSMHHNYYGGLAEHTANVAQSVKLLGGFYHLDTDILVTAALLHDIGKIYEYTQKGPIDMTSEGHLLGHITLSDEMVSEKAKTLPQFSRSELTRLRHLLLSHHGLLEYGSPRLPQTPEAFLLHYADNVDAKIACLLHQMEIGRSENKEWQFVKSLGQYVWAGSPLPRKDSE